MKAVLLAAGRGTRISRMIENVPKCTLPIMNQPLIRRSVECLLNRGIQVAVCIGYQHRKVQEVLGDWDITYYYNPFYDVTNSLGSLWMAREFIDDHCLFMNADVYWTERLLDSVIADENDVVMSIDKSRINVGDYFFQTAGDCIRKYGKNLPIEERSGEYVGLAKITKPFVPQFLTRMEEMIERQESNRWWEEVLYSFTNERDVYTLDVNGEFWAEVDYYDDYERILSFVDQKTN